MINRHAGTGGCENACCLKIEHLSVKIGTDVILDDINLHMHCGQIVALIGPNGAGKSTLIRSILGQRTYEGKITFHSADGKQTKLRIGYVPQSPAFDPADPISVLDLFTCCISRRPAFLRAGKALREQVQTCLARVHGESLMDKRVGTLSGGEQQMLAVGRALMSRPKLMMLDEPSLGLAPVIVTQVFDIIKEINRQGITVLLIEQNANMALKTADWAYVMQTGTILMQGEGKELLENEEVKAAYLGKAK